MFVVDELLERFTNVPGVHHILATPILTALLVVIIFMIAAYLVVRPHWKGSFWAAFLRLGLYSVAGAMAVMSLHHRVKKAEYLREARAASETMELAHAAQVNVGGDLDYERTLPMPAAPQPAPVQQVVAQPVVQPPIPQPVVQQPPIMVAPPAQPIAMYTTQPVAPQPMYVRVQ